MEITGYITTAIIVLGMFVEIIPVKISPLAMLGKRLNKSTNDRLDKLEKKVEDNDIDTLRNRILASEALLRKGEVFTEKQWENLYKDITKWNMYHETHKELNGFLQVVIENINVYYKSQTLNVKK